MQTLRDLSVFSVDRFQQVAFAKFPSSIQPFSEAFLFPLLLKLEKNHYYGGCDENWLMVNYFFTLMLYVLVNSGQKFLVNGYILVF